jgi:hypothetical protein
MTKGTNIMHIMNIDNPGDFNKAILKIHQKSKEARKNLYVTKLYHPKNSNNDTIQFYQSHYNPDVGF